MPSIEKQELNSKLGAKLSSLHNSINFNISSSDQFAIFRYHTSAYHAHQTIIMHELYSAHALKLFWNSKRSYCTVLERSGKATFAIQF